MSVVVNTNQIKNKTRSRLKAFTIMKSIFLNCVRRIVKAIFRACCDECHKYSVESKSTARIKAIFTQ